MSIDCYNLLKDISSSERFEVDFNELVDLSVNLLCAMNSNKVIRVLAIAFSRIPSKYGTAFDDLVCWFRQLQHLKQVDGLTCWLFVAELDVIYNV